MAEHEDIKPIDQMDADELIAELRRRCWIGGDERDVEVTVGYSTVIVQLRQRQALSHGDWDFYGYVSDFAPTLTEALRKIMAWAVDHSKEGTDG